MRANIWDALCQNHLTLDQTSTPLEIDRYEVEHFYYPLALRLNKVGRNKKRVLVAVAGPPGSGKTAFATLLVAVINAELQSKEAVLIQQDGWHFPNEYLDSHTIQREGKEISLRQIKGSPETYDTEAAFTFLKSIKEGKEMDYPVYSRQLHDPIPHSGCVTAKHRIVILEGNYWLLQEHPWRRFQVLFDVRILLAAPCEKLMEGLLQRHLRGGKTLEVSKRQIANVDLPNIKRVVNNSAPAEIRIQKVDSRHISSIEYVKNTQPAEN